MKTLRAEVFKSLRMRIEMSALYLLNVKHENIKIARRRYLRIKLTKRARRRISRICKRSFAVFLALFVQTEKALFRHIDLASYFKQRKLVRQRKRYCFYGFYI